MYLNLLSNYINNSNNHPIAISHHQPGSHQAVLSHSHNYTEVALITAGSGIHHFSNCFSKISVGDVLIIPEGIHHYYSESMTLGVINLLFNPQSFISDEMFNSLNSCFSGAFVPQTASPSPCINLNEENIAVYLDNISALEIEFYRNNIAAGFGMSNRLHELLMFLINTLDTSSNPEIRNRFSTVISFINNNYEKNISVTQLCSMTNMSRRNFFRSFKSCIGCTPVEYLTRIRVKAASDMLKNSNLSMSEIAFSCGFCDSNFFSKQFRTHCEISPSDFRRKHKNIIEAQNAYVNSLHSVIMPDNTSAENESKTEETAQ